MSDLLTISKTRVLKSDEDFQFLREEGLKYIENLAHALWTDYNTHDPGVTILEALCYAITELGYRSDFAMPDLLADKDGKVDVDQTFFTAKNIFRNNSLTVEDYRKILVDTIGVHNAFMFPKQNVADLTAAEIPKTEVPFYPECKKDRLVYKNTDHPAIDVRGLYKVLVDLDNTETFGDLNIGNIYYSLRDSTMIGVNVEAILPAWRDMEKKTISKIIGNITAVTATENTTSGIWKINLQYLDGAIAKSFDYSIRKTINSEEPDADSKITSEIKKEVTQESILKMYVKKLEYIEEVLQECWNKLHSQRELCEDFLSIDTVLYTGVAVCADIEAEVGADIEEILGNVYFLIEQYFSPTLNFYLLQEMIAKGIPTDEIFEGPNLLHGFIDTNELINAQLRSEIRVSDIINLIMDIPGVIAVKNLLLTSYDDKGNIIQSGQKWCLHLAPFHKPVPDIYRSKILFFKTKLPFRAKISEALNVLRLLEANNERPKLKGHRDDLVMPTGQHYQLDDYLTVQYELPQTYGVSAAGLSKEETYQRKAQAKQLRAYLLFYDQLLANFFSQLSHAKDLFSLNNSIDQTYFTQFLTAIKDIETIYRKVDLAAVDNHSYDLQEVLNGPVVLPTNTADPNYKIALYLNQLHGKLIEDEDTFDNRRNRFLNHLIARFAETFDNYVFLLYTADKERIGEKTLINDKILFLKDYPVISAERGKAFDYLEDSWNTFNVSGLEKRASRFTGIHNFMQRNLFCLPDFDIINNGTAADPKYSFDLLNKNHDIIIKSIIEYMTLEETENTINKVYESMFDKNNFKILKNASAVFEIQLFSNGSQIAILEKTYPNNLAAAAYLRNFIKEMRPECDPEGMHLIEHILLRPHFPPVGPNLEDDYKLMQVCLNDDCVFCGEEDTYSFRVSVLLPFWPARFRDIDFRRYVEDVFQFEAPAHVAVKVCWINYTSMKKFEMIYKEWLKALKTFGVDLKKTNATKKQQLKIASNKMVEFLAKVHSEYPEARLHDCDTSVTNPVRLGSTILGSF
jgi:hypothetical protein